MGLIRYNIKNGTLPITAELVGSGLNPNIHNVYEEGEFIAPQNQYILKITDADLCIREYTIDFCDCPDGYESVNNGCVKYEQVAANLTLPLKQINKKSYGSYGQYGTLIFDEGWNYNGTGNYEKIDVNNSYWINTGRTLIDGPLNRNAVWAEDILIPHDIGFSFCIDLLVEKTYYIGVGCDNWSKIKVNGEYILDQGVHGGTLNNALQDLMTMMNVDAQVTFKYWFIYPVVLKSGRNIIEVQGHNHTLYIAGLGMEIYDASKIDLMNARNDADLEGKILWRSKDMVNQYLDYTYNPVDGYRGYNCPEEYGIVTCEDEVFCENKIFIEC